MSEHIYNFERANFRIVHHPTIHPTIQPTNQTKPTSQPSNKPPTASIFLYLVLSISLHFTGTLLLQICWCCNISFLGAFSELPIRKYIICTCSLSLSELFERIYVCLCKGVCMSCVFLSFI